MDDDDAQTPEDFHEDVDAEEEEDDDDLDVPEDGTDDDSNTDSSDDDEDNLNDSEPPSPMETPLDAPQISEQSMSTPPPLFAVSSSVPPSVPPPPPSTRPRSLSPAFIRRKAIKSTLSGPFAVEAVCALPHPCPTHSLAASACFSHFLTGSQDGYIRDYDIYPSLNGKTFLSAPQRHHAGVVEGTLKAGQLRSWWENPEHGDDPSRSAEEDASLSPVFSMVMQSDALWSAAGTESGNINLFTVRHEPGNRFHVIKNAHQGPVSAMCLDADEMGLFSAGWDGFAVHWDLNTGREKRRFRAHAAQLSTIAIRPVGAPRNSHSPMDVDPSQALVAEEEEDDAKSDGSLESLFTEKDDEKEEPLRAPLQPEKPSHANHGLAVPVSTAEATTQQSSAPRNAPPLLTRDTYPEFSPDLLMTTFMDGQVILWDCRVKSSANGVGRLSMHDKTPPWCMSSCWSADGSQIYAGRRNGTIDVWDVRQFGSSGPKDTPRMLKTLRNPPSSGVVSCVVAFPDNRHIACASIDNLRLWDAADAAEPDTTMKPRSGVPFKIIPGHHGGYISQMIIDKAGRFLMSASSNRGWHGDSTRTVFVHDIKPTKQ